MEISVIIPTYEPKSYIYECLESLENQTLDKSLFEVILLLNGKREPYETQIKTYLKNKKMNVKVYYSEKKGVSNARNLGLKVSRGKNITFVDDDDFISDNYLAELLKERLDEKNIVQANVNDFVDNNLKKYIFNDKNYPENRFEEDIVKFKFVGSLSTVWGKLIPKEVIGETIFNSKFSNGEDTLFMSEISKNIKSIKTVGKETCYYRRERSDSLHFKKRSRLNKNKNLLNLIKYHFYLLLKNNSNKKFVIYRIISLILGCFR